MRVGLNWVSPHSLPVLQTLIAEGEVNFCEVMLDNVVHLCPKKVRAALASVPVSFHLVSSRFLEKERAELTFMAEHIKPWIDEFEPLYFSDHLLFFTADGKYLSTPLEPDYAIHFDLICQKVRQWQLMLGVPLLLENNASTTIEGRAQATWVERVLRETNTHLLFDISNAHLAELNQIASIDAWLPLLQRTQHFHVAGYRFDEQAGLWQDTHDTAIATEVYAWMQRFISMQSDTTIVLEFDSLVDETILRAELTRVRQTMGAVK